LGISSTQLVGFLFSKFKHYPLFLQNFAFFWIKYVIKIFSVEKTTEKSY